MSVKFQETVQTKVTGVAKGLKEKNEDITHRIGEYLTGGEVSKGYLAVRLVRTCLTCKLTSTGIPQAASEEPSADEDVDLGCVGWRARSACVLAGA